MKALPGAVGMDRMNHPAWGVYVAAALAVLAALALPLPSGRAAPVHHTFHLTARQFEYSPAILLVNPGDRVTIELSSTDVVHGLAIDGYNLVMISDPGQTSRLTFIANRSGSFRFRCSMTCGNLHPFMIGRLYVGPNTLLWRAGGVSVLLLMVGLWKLWK